MWSSPLLVAHTYLPSPCVFIAFLFPVLPLIRTPVILGFCISPLIRHTWGRFEAAIAQLLEYLPGIREALS